MDKIFFSDWQSILRTIIIATLAYAALVMLLRVSGKRTLSKMNAFDLVVTVALGSTLATVLLNKNVALAEGVLALAMLIGMQYLVAWTSCRFETIERLVKSEPRLLLYRGKFLQESLLRERVTESEIRAAARAEGYISLEEVDAVVLETDGTFSIVAASDKLRASAMKGVLGFELPDRRADSAGAA